MSATSDYCDYAVDRQATAREQLALARCMAEYHRDAGSVTKQYYWMSKAAALRDALSSCS